MAVADLSHPAPDELEAACLAAERRVQAFEAQLGDPRALDIGGMATTLRGQLAAARLDLERARDARAKATATTARSIG